MNENEIIIVKNLMELVLGSSEITMKVDKSVKVNDRFMELHKRFNDLPLQHIEVKDNEVKIRFAALLFDWLEIETSDKLMNLEKYIIVEK